MNKPPAFQFYVKDWRSSPTVLRMSMHHRGVYITLLAAAWDNDQPGTLPLPVEVAARSVGLDVRSLRDFMSKCPRCFEEINGKLVNRKLLEQAAKMREISEKRSEAGKLGHQTNAEQVDSTAFAPAVAPAPAGKKKVIVTPIPPEATDLAEQLFRRMRENNPNCKVTEHQKRNWANDARLMIEQDGRQPEDIAAVIDWSQSDWFWCAHTLQMAKVRKDFDRFVLLMRKPDGNGGKNAKSKNDPNVALAAAAAFDERRA